MKHEEEFIVCVRLGAEWEENASRRREFPVQEICGWETEAERLRDTQRDRHTDRDTQRDRHRNRERNSLRQTERQRH